MGGFAQGNDYVLEFSPSLFENLAEDKLGKLTSSFDLGTDRLPFGLRYATIEAVDISVGPPRQGEAFLAVVLDVDLSAKPDGGQGGVEARIELAFDPKASVKGTKAAIDFEFSHLVGLEALGSEHDSSSPIWSAVEDGVRELLGRKELRDLFKQNLDGAPFGVGSRTRWDVDLEVLQGRPRPSSGIASRYQARSPRQAWGAGAIAIAIDVGHRRLLRPRLPRAEVPNRYALVPAGQEFALATSGQVLTAKVNEALGEDLVGTKMPKTRAVYVRTAIARVEAETIRVDIRAQRKRRRGHWGRIKYDIGLNLSIDFSADDQSVEVKVEDVHVDSSFAAKLSHGIIIGLRNFFSKKGKVGDRLNKVVAREARKQVDQMTSSLESMLDDIRSGVGSATGGRLRMAYVGIDEGDLVISGHIDT